MHYGLTFVLLSVLLLCACDSEISGTVSSETIPRQNPEGCAIDQELALSDCPAIEITGICNPFLCRVDPGQTIEDEIALATDYTLPECDTDCKAMDCNTIECTDSNTYGDIDVAINQDGEISVTGILNEEVVFTCTTRASCGN